MSSLAGLDVNGLWDWAAYRDPESGKPDLQDAGINGAAVRLVRNREIVVAGPQSALAPHGRGAGWGEMGKAQHRIRIADCLAALASGNANDDQADAIRAIVNQMARGATSIVAAVPDEPGFDEGARDRLLRTLRGSRTAALRLLWRPIAAILGWAADADDCFENVSENTSAAVLSIQRDGVYIAEAKLDIEIGRLGPLIVPVRSQGGRSVVQGHAGAAFAQIAAEILAPRIGQSESTILANAQLPWHVSVGKRTTSEIIRLPDNSWCELNRPEVDETHAPKLQVDQMATTQLGKADIILIEGPASENTIIVGRLLRTFGLAANDKRLFRVNCRAVARGCLEANERLSRGDPVYYDFLPQLEINALVDDEPTFVSLIPKGKRLKGGDVYRDHAVGDFAIGAGATSLSFYLIKEDFERLRKSDVLLGEKADTQHRISVTVEQSPGQGYAKVRIGSDSFAPLRRQPVELDWATMSEVCDDRDAVLKKIRDEGQVAYPNVQIYPGHAVLWHPRSRHGNVVEALRGYLARPLLSGRAINPDGLTALQELRALASKAVRPSYEGRRLKLSIAETRNARFLATDGSLPQSMVDLPVPEDAGPLLDAALAKVAEEFPRLAVIPNLDPSRLSDAIGFATWCYWRCPQSICEWMIARYASGESLPRGLPILLTHGLGRVVHRPNEIERFLTAIDGRLVQGRRVLSFNEYAALGRILGGCEDAAVIVLPSIADKLVQNAYLLIEEENRATQDAAYKKKFKYALLMLAVLLRHRKRNRLFLVPGQSRASETLLNLMGETGRRILSFAEAFQRSAARTGGASRQKKLAAERRLRAAYGIMEELVFFIHLEGRDPNIIQRIDAFGEDDDDVVD